MTTVPEDVEGATDPCSTPADRPASWDTVDLPATIENLSTAVVVTDLDGRLRYANRQAERAFGWVADQLVGLNVGELSGVWVPHGTAVEIGDALRAGKPWSGEFDFERPDGTLVTVAVSDSGLLDPSGELVGVVSIVTDVTEARQSVRQLVSETEALRFLLDAATIVSSAVGLEDAVRSLAALAVPLLADLCIVDVLVDGSIERMAVVHADPGMATLAERLYSFPPRLTGDHPVGRMLRSGVNATAGDMDDAFLRATTFGDEHYGLTKQMGFESYMCAPLRARGRVAGTVTLVSAGSGRRFRSEDLALVEALADRVANVVDNARLYSEQARVARSLQAALLPRALPPIQGVQVAAVYQAAGEGNEVGGDFYDVFDVGRGMWAVTIGDVCGRGPDAAAITGLVRHAFHASGRNTRNPTAMLQFANSMIGEEEGRSEERFCTAAAALVKPGRPLRVSFASAGHPPALLRRSDGKVVEVRAPGITLGVIDDIGGKPQKIALEDGDLMVMYTDGLIEARDPSGSFYGEARLMESVSRALATSPQGLVDAVVADLRSFTGGRLADDLAVIVFGPVAVKSA